MSFEEMLDTMDSYQQPGVTQEQLDALIAICACGVVVSRRRFAHHECYLT